jgi:hypothetical protein
MAPHTRKVSPDYFQRVDDGLIAVPNHPSSEGDFDIYYKINSKHRDRDFAGCRDSVPDGVTSLPWVAVRNSSVADGKGLFALRNFGFCGGNAHAERIGKYEGEPITAQETRRRVQSGQSDKILHLSALRSEYDHLDGAGRGFAPGMYGSKMNDHRGTGQRQNVRFTPNGQIVPYASDDNENPGRKVVKRFTELLTNYGDAYWQDSGSGSAAAAAANENEEEERGDEGDESGELPEDWVYWREDGKDNFQAPDGTIVCTMKEVFQYTKGLRGGYYAGRFFGYAATPSSMRPRL